MATEPAAEAAVVTGRASSAQLHSTRNLSCHSAVDMLASIGGIGKGAIAEASSDATGALDDDEEAAALEDDEDEDEEEEEEEEEEEYEEACFAMTLASEVDPSPSSSSSSSSSSSAAFPFEILSGTAYD